MTERTFLKRFKHHCKIMLRVLPKYLIIERIRSLKCPFQTKDRGGYLAVEEDEIVPYAYDYSIHEYRESTKYWGNFGGDPVLRQKMIAIVRGIKKGGRKKHESP